MQFGQIEIDQAEGAIFAHSLRLPSLTLRKGDIVDAQAIAALRSSGVKEIAGARLEPGDIGENEVARRIAQRLGGDHVEARAAFTGRCNLFATRNGLLRVDAMRIDRVNAIDEAITTATLAPLRRVAEGEMVATVKIIPFAIGAQTYARACAATNQPALAISPFTLRRAGVISTRLPGLKSATIAKTIHNLEARLSRAGAPLVSRAEVPHEAEALTIALRAVERQCDVIVIFGASAIVDRRDVVPTAIEAAGGQIEHFGMPVDPGNLLLLGTLRGLPVIGAPGCARSSKENGFDFVLDRVLAQLPIKGADIRRLGVGGLLGEIGSRPQPRDGSRSQDKEHD